MLSDGGTEGSVPDMSGRRVDPGDATLLQGQTGPSAQTRPEICVQPAAARNGV